MQILQTLYSTKDSNGVLHRYARIKGFQGINYVWLVNDEIHMYCDTFNFKKEFKNYLTKHNLKLDKE